MKISDKLLDLFNQQIKLEYDSRNVYFGMESYLRNEAWDGFANWYMVQADEEMAHCRYFMEFLAFIGEKWEMRALDQQTNDYESVLDVWEKALEHEKFITASIEKIYDQAVEDKNYLAQKFLDWYINEQAEEEDTFGNWLDRVKRAGEGPGLMILDQEAATRVWAAPTDPPVEPL